MGALSFLRSRLKTLDTINQSPHFILSSYFSSKQRTNDANDHDTNDVVSLFNRDPNSPPQLFVVQPRLRPDTFLQAKLNEALCLANSLEEQRDGYFHSDFFHKPLPPHLLVQNPVFRSSKARADTFFGPGTVDNIRSHLYGVQSKSELDAVFVNAILSGIQQRNLERKWGKPVLDRVGLIIEIFNAHAHTREAKLQAELAALMYKRSRLVRVRGKGGRLTFGSSGEAEVVSARGRGSGGRGFISGAGETELQLQRRRIIERRNHLLSQIEEVRRTRGLQRYSRRRHGSDHKGLATVAIVGYTNAGKSTLVSALSNSYLYSDSRLFATLDPRLKSVLLPSGTKVLLSDTVGFISDLPIQLVEAFHATLEEVVEADLLVHVIDSTAPNLDEHRTTVLEVLHQIGVSEEKLSKMIEVWNKIDYESEEMDAKESVEDPDGGSLSVDEDDDDDISADISLEVDDNVGDGKWDLESSTGNADGDYSDEWLLSGDEQEIVGDSWLKNLSEQQSNTAKNLGLEKYEASEGPHVRTSAITGVGLQELLQLIDERLQDGEKVAQNVVGRGFIDRKWRPPRTAEADAEIAVEQ
ncbi:GTP-binding protein HflX [Euphorbia peplus]|nr:GTP-binding protein HflX [Euphorbia peplus]